MSLSLKQLMERPTRSGMTAFIIGELDALGFETAGWGPDSIQRKFFTAIGGIAANVAGSTVVGVARSVFNRHAIGAALREYSQSAYDNTQQGAVKTKGYLVLTSTATVPYDIEPSQLVASDPNNIEFTNLGGGTIPPGATIQVEFEALLAGAAGNVANNTITILRTPIAGVSINNPPQSNGVWYSRSGADPERADKLRRRNRTKWGTLNQIAMPVMGYEHLALSIPAVTKVVVDATNPRGPNTLDVYIATASGPPTATEIADCQALMNLKKSPQADVLVKAPASKTVPIVGTAYIEAAKNTPARQAEVIQALRDVVNATPIGGHIINGSRMLPQSEIITAASSRSGVTAFSLTVPSADVLMTAFDLATVVSPAIAFEAV